MSLLLRGLLGASAAISALTIVFSFSRLTLFGRINRGNFTIAEVEASDAQATMIAGLFLLVHLATVITWIVWQSRTSHNARALGTEYMQFGPNAWGWFFCPFINLYRPLAVVTELWEVNEPDSSAPTPGFFGLWWVTWVIGSLISNAASRMVDDDSTIDEFITSTQLDMAANAALLVSAVVAIKVIAAVHQREHARATGRRVSQS